MGSHTTDMKLCGICLKDHAVTECNGCLRPLCKGCRSIQIWRTADEEVIIKSFCPQCRDDPQVNPQGNGEGVFGLGNVADMVNQEQGRPGNFRIKLKVT